jgi:DNA-directed RNA polymerase specialized sigma24 family protein
MWPSDGEIHDAWRRLVADPDAATAFVELVLPPLETALRGSFPHTDPHAVTEAAGNAVLALVRNPAAFDPARGKFVPFLRRAARCDLFNILKAGGRHHRDRIPWANVELTPPAGNDPSEAETFADHPELLAAVGEMSPDDQRVFELMRDGERDTPVFAAALGIAHLSADEQAAEVKRAKDRVMARLKRARGER